MKYILLFTLLYVCSTDNYAQTKITKKSCATVKSKIDTINKKMRNKYSAKQGERFRDKLRVLYKKENQCRKKRYKTK